MNSLARALTNVGFRPRKKRDPEALLNSLVDRAVNPISKPQKPKVTQVHLTGNGFYLARWQGESRAVFGTSPEDARNRLLSGRLGRGKGYPKKGDN